MTNRTFPTDEQRAGIQAAIRKFNEDVRPWSEALRAAGEQWHATVRPQVIAAVNETAEALRVEFAKTAEALRKTGGPKA